MKVQCINCGDEFEFEVVVETLEGVDIHYAECSHCPQRYLSYVVDKEMRERFEKTARLLSRSKNPRRTFTQQQKAQRKHKNMVDENRRLMKQKKAEYQYLTHQVIHGQDDKNKSS